MINQEYRALGSSPSIIRELFMYGLKQAEKVGPENVFDFSLGNPSIPAPDEVTDSLREILETEDPVQVHGYSSAAGFQETREAVAADLRRRFGLDTQAEEIFMTCGAAPALISVIKALTAEKGSEILVLAPFFPEYRPFIESNGAKCVVVPAFPPCFGINPAAIEPFLTAKSQAIIVNSPNNPSGAVYSEADLLALADLLRRKSAEYGHPLYIIADEPYRELVYDGTEVPFIPSLYENTVVCYSWSKSLSLPGERIGYVYVPSFAADSRDLFQAVAGAARIMGHVCPPTLIQKAVARCVRERPDLAAYDENRRLLYDALTGMGYECVKPEGAFYLFVKVPDGDAGAFSERAKTEHNLLVVPADGFGSPGWMRLAYCVSRQTIVNSLPAFRAMIEECPE
ncbi:MAG: pyridoxal phosphate-dependent aminotransferase [Oscillospiraceae bacterium]|nr:pyridoxal phosphate-dependent aminotransferase [Oscillospiraceae bacterium]